MTLRAGIGHYAVGGMARPVVPYGGDPLRYGYGPEHSFFGNNQLPVVDLPPLTPEEAGLVPPAGAGQTGGNSGAAGAAGTILTGLTTAALIDKLTGGTLSTAAKELVTSILGDRGITIATDPFAPDLEIVRAPPGTTGGPGVPVTPDFNFGDTSPTFGDPNEGVPQVSAPNYGFGEVSDTFGDPNEGVPQTPVIPNYGFGEVSDTFGSPMEGVDWQGPQTATEALSGTSWPGGILPFDNPALTPEFPGSFVGEPVGGMYGADAAGDLMSQLDPDAAAELGAALESGYELPDILSSPWIAGPAFAFSLYNLISDPSIESGIGTAISGASFANSLGLLGPSFPSLWPFGIVPAAMALGQIFDPLGNHPPAGIIAINPDGTVLDRGMQPGTGSGASMTPQMEAFKNAVVGELSKKGPLPYFGPSEEELARDTTPREVLVPSFTLATNEDDPNRVAVIWTLPGAGGGGSSIVYTSAKATPKEVADAIFSALTPESYQEHARKAAEDRENVRLASADIGHAEGGLIEEDNPAMASPYAHVGPVSGPGGGQDDLIPAYLSNNEYVIPADVTSGLGDGSPDVGARKLDELVANIRAHKAVKGHPPKAKPIERYIGIGRG